jgi:small subunit ribosomal protein S5
MVKKSFSKKGGRKPRREKPEFEQKLLDLARVTRVVKGGRRFSFRATLVIGNRKGKVGVGVAKGADVSIAMSKAFADAKKHMVIVKRSNNTISFDINKKEGAAKIMLRPAKEGRGIVAGGAMRPVLELAGVKDVVAKSHGTSNKINVARATLSALEDLSQKLVGTKEEKRKVVKAEGSSEKSTEKASKTEKVAVPKKEAAKAKKATATKTKEAASK